MSTGPCSVVSRCPNKLHASIAALFAPGPSAGFELDFRRVVFFSLERAVRRVVRRACLSGLDVRDVLFSGDNRDSVENWAVWDGEGEGGPGSTSAVDVLSSSLAFGVKEGLERPDLRLNISGRARSVYVTAGIVPSPIHPGSLVVLVS